MSKMAPINLASFWGKQIKLHMTKVEETIADSPDMLWACAVALSLGENVVVC